MENLANELWCTVFKKFQMQQTRIQFWFSEYIFSLSACATESNRSSVNTQWLAHLSVKPKLSYIQTQS